MNNSEKIKHLIAELKACPDAQLSICFSAVVDVFLLLPKAEQHKTAVEFYKWAKAHATLQPLRFCHAKFLMAWNCFLRDHHEPALRLATEAQKLFENLNHRDGVALCGALMSGIYRTLGNIQLALKTQWESYLQLKTSGVYPHFTGGCTFNLAHIYLEMQNYDEALGMFKAMYEQADKTKDHFWMPYALHGLAKVYMLQNKYADAKEFLEKAMLLAPEEENPQSIANCYTELANFYFRQGDLSMGEELHKKALDIREKNRFVGGAVTNCIHLGEIYIAQSNYEGALAILLKGLAMAEQIKVKPKIFQVHLLLSKIYECRCEPEKSLTHFKLFHEVRERVEKEDSARRLKNAHLVFEAEQTQKENVIIKKQKCEIEKKNVELQDTIDELTKAKIGKKAKAFTLVIAIVFFIFEDFILHTVLNVMPDNYFLLLIIKMVIIFSLNPINKMIEEYLLKKVIRGKKHAHSKEEEPSNPEHLSMSYS